MSSGPTFSAELAGINAEVIKPDASGAGGVGIGGFAAFDDATGEPLFGLAIRHADGTILAALLDEAAIDVVAGQMADFLEALPTIRSAVRH